MAEYQNTDPELEVLRLNKESGYLYRERRQEDWRENYTLYRDRPTLNRLTQRQSVHVPLMKQTVRTLLKDVDDMPVLLFENLDNDKQAEVFLNEYWKWTVEANKLELKDIVDKRQVFLFGRSFDQMQIENGRVEISIVDPQDILIDRYVDPTDIDTARFLIHTHIYVPLSTLAENPDYNQEKVSELIKWHATDQGLIKAAENKQMATEKNLKMSDMGLQDIDSPIFGETIIELTQHFVYHKEEDEEEQLYMFVEADDMCILMKKPLEEIIGKTEDNYWRTHFPYNTWADDVERQDFWSDGVGDIVRTPNRLADAWFSQVAENRTLKNLNMNIFNSNLEGFTPQTWEPRAWGMYGVPVPQGGKIADVFQPLPVSDLSDSIDELQYVIGMIEKATGATSTQQGVQTEKQITLGEVKLALTEAKERIKGMSKFYTPAWKERGAKFLKLIEAAPDKLDAVKVYKKGRNSDKLYQREIAPPDWMTKSGYTVRVWSQDEKNAENTSALERSNAIKANMPDNPVVDRGFKRKLLEFGDFTPDEINDAMKFEEEKRKQQLEMQNMMMQGGMMPVDAETGQPAQPKAAPLPVQQ